MAEVIHRKEDRILTARKLKDLGICLLGSLILACTAALLRDCFAVLRMEDMTLRHFWKIFGEVFVLLMIHFRKRPKLLLGIAAGVLAAVCVIGGSVCYGWWHFYRSTGFKSLDHGKTQLYSGKTVMMIVPHEDDDLNLMNGALEEYVRYGSTVYPVFVTNGDYKGKTTVRFRETLSVMERVGIPAEQVIFLGYGDNCQEEGPHLYNAEPGVVLESPIGYTATYGTDLHPAYREGRAYTSENFLEDLHDVIAEYRPDILFCTDYDDHIDHMAVSLAFEKVMGSLLKEDPTYRPLVFKGYAYSTAWYAPEDFYAVNILSTQNVFVPPIHQTPAVYRWEERTRLPVWDGSLARSLLACDTTKNLALYHSQNALEQAPNIINGDKVYWYRDTNSVCLLADIQVSSGNGSLLNDFMLLEHNNLIDTKRLPTDGTWVPEDGQKTALVTLPEPADIDCIRLYDNPSAQDNVLSGVIAFSDGSQVDFGPLDPLGAGVVIPVHKRGIMDFRITLTRTEGEQAGLTEVEAFQQQPESGLRFVKLMDSEENFLYDYCLTNGSKDTLTVYTAGLTDAERERLTLSWDNKACSAALEDGVIRIVCPRWNRMTLTVTLDGSDISDTIRIRHPGKLTRTYYSACRILDKKLFPRYVSIEHKRERFLGRSAVYKMLYSNAKAIE